MGLTLILPVIAALLSEPVTMVTIQMASFIPTSCSASSPTLRSSVDAALSRLSRVLVASRHNVSSVVYDSCSPATTLETLVTILQDGAHDIIIGPGSQQICDSALNLAQHHNVAMVSWTCFNHHFEQITDMTPLTTSTAPPVYGTVDAMTSVLTHFKWKYINLMVTEHVAFRDSGLELHVGLSKAGFEFRSFYVFEINVTSQTVSDALQKNGSPGGVMLLVADDEELNAILQGIVDVYKDLGSVAVIIIRTHIPLNVSDKLHMESPILWDSQLEGVLQNVMILQAHAQKLLNTSGNAAVNISNYKFSDFNEYLYDSVSLGIEAILATLNDSVPLTATNILARFINKTFAGLHGPILLGRDGQVQYVHSLWDFNGSNESFEIRMEISNGSVVTSKQDLSWYKGRQPPGNPCDFELCDAGLGIGKIMAIILVSTALVVTVITVGLVIRRRLSLNELTRGPNKILLYSDDLVFVHSRATSKSIKSMKSIFDKPDLLKGSVPSLSNHSSGEFVDHSDTARYNGDLVFVKGLHIKDFEVKGKVRPFLRQLRDMRHENVNVFLGCYVNADHSGLVWEYCSRRSLEDVIDNENIKLDWDFKLSLINDLVKGIRYIHASPIKLHGRLKSGNCVIDSRWVLKVTDYGVHSMLQRYQHTSDMATKDLLWTAPELLRDKQLFAVGTQKGDIFSFAIIMQEIILRGHPYCMLSIDHDAIIAKIKKPPPLCRPSVSPQAASPQYIQIMKQCWAEMPEMRPDSEQLHQQFKEMCKGKKTNIVDTMFKMLEKYSNDLEEIVRERTVALEEEKKKTENLLTQMLPKSVAESLLHGKPVEAETYDDVTIYFSDIVGFTTISAASTPMQVVQLLNDLYTMFDATIDDYDVYKVETIGDAYMVVSGLPNKNGNRHAGEISMMALSLLSQCGQFKMRHMPDVPMRLRIGLHTGSCVAGVVGLRMPRYCLFGDTVNTASRMESTGLAFRIHLSEKTKLRLDDLGGYICSYRGEVELKGKGIHKTYWLTGKEGFYKPLPEPPDSLENCSQETAK